VDKSEIFHRIAEDAAKNGISFSTHSGVALKLQKALNDPDCSVDKAARLASGEPLLAARIVAMANSVAYKRGDREIADIKQAVSLVGFRVVQMLAMALAVRQMAGTPRDPRIRAMAEKLWEHTANVAALAFVVARHATRLDGETALFAALLHEVAGFHLLSRASEFPGLLDGEPANWVSAWKDDGEALIGRSVLRELEAPAVVQAAIEDYWLGLLALPPVSLGDTLLLADSLSPVMSPLQEDDTTAMVMERRVSIETAVGVDTLTHILDESVVELASLTQALKF